MLDRNSVDGEVQGGILRRRCYLCGARSTGAQLVPEYGHKSAVGAYAKFLSVSVSAMVEEAAQGKRNIHRNIEGSQLKLGEFIAKGSARL